MMRCLQRPPGKGLGLTSSSPGSYVLQNSMGGASQPHLCIRNIWGALDNVTQTIGGTTDIPDLTDREREALGIR